MNEPQIDNFTQSGELQHEFTSTDALIVRKMNGKTQNNKHGAHTARFRDFGISMPDAGRERIEFKGKVQQQHVAIK